MAGVTLSRNEKLTLLLSSIALAVSVVSPIVNYYWLQTSVREQRLKAAALKASGSYWIFSDWSDRSRSERQYEVELANDGDLSIDSVSVATRLHGHAWSAHDRDRVEIDPPVRTKIALQEDMLLITLTDPFPPGQTLRIRVAVIVGDPDTIAGRAPSSWVSSEASPSVPVVWEYRGGGGGR